MLSHWFILIGFGFPQQQSELILLSWNDSAPFVLPFIVLIPFILFYCQSSVSLGLQVISNSVGCYNPGPYHPAALVPMSLLGQCLNLWFDMRAVTPSWPVPLGGDGEKRQRGQGLGMFPQDPRKGTLWEEVEGSWSPLCRSWGWKT